MQQMITGTIGGRSGRVRVQIGDKMREVFVGVEGYTYSPGLYLQFSSRTNPLKSQSNPHPLHSKLLQDPPSTLPSASLSKSQPLPFVEADDVLFLLCPLRATLVHWFQYAFQITMKAIILACLLVAILAVNPLEKYEQLARQDDCVANVFDLVKPEIDAKLEELKTNKDLSLQVELLALLEKGKTMLDKCNAKKPQPVFGDIVEWDGIAFLLASNCFKDVGIELLLADTVVQSPKDYTNDIVVAIFGYILGRQAVADCKQFEQFII